MLELNLHVSNRLERLVDILSGMLISRPPANPLASEYIIVQSQGMARWLALELAQKHGICANYNFLFPNKFLEIVFDATADNSITAKTLDTTALTWNIMRYLKEPQDHPEFGVVRNYIKNDNDGLKLYQLSSRIADLFDQYTIYRPEMVLGWDKNPADNWQAILWKKLITEPGIPHRAALFKKFFEKISHGKFKSGSFPRRVAVFGNSSLPPTYIETLKALSQVIEINLFVMNPCSEYWADILSEKESEKLKRKLNTDQYDESDLHFEVGNSLLASMGKQGRDFLDLLADQEHLEKYDDPGEGSLLCSIQSDILTLKQPGTKKKSATKVKPDDTSLQIHICHSEMREIEVLRDNLLRLFDTHPDLLPKDILVMAPDIERYTPFIQSVFGNPEDDNLRIPFTIADRSIRTGSRIIEIFFELLDLVGGKLEVSKIMAILDAEAVRSKFKLSSSDIELITEWVRRVNIRWGADSAHKKHLELPEYNENTWRFGLDRLLLGYALPGYEQQTFDGILPYDNIEGESALILGRFAEFMDFLTSSIFDLESKYSPSQWADKLTSLCNNIFQSDTDTEYELKILTKAFARLREIQTEISFDDKVSIGVIKQYLKDTLAGQSSVFGFIAGSVTFCAMLPMRSIPFKTICLIGMNSDSFPRQAKHQSFDLIAQKPKIGDRSTRHTDRYLFLEALLSAREMIYISYLGQSITDNKPRPPSVLVSELIDYLKKGYKTETDDIESQITTKHRLQAFSDEYFVDDSKLFSYSAENFQAAKTKIDGSRIISQLFECPLPEIESEQKQIDIKDLCRFYANPAKFLLNRRLGIYLETDDITMDDNEPYGLSGLERYKLSDKLLELQLKRGDTSGEYELAKASGLLPQGAFGKICYDELSSFITGAAKKIKPYIKDESPTSIPIDMAINGYQLSGTIDNIYQSGIISYRPASVKAKDILSCWVVHLVYSCAIKDGKLKSHHAGMDKTITFDDTKQPEIHLNNLIKLFDQGIKIPTMFFPETSMRYAESITQNKSVDIAVKSAAGIWAGSEWSRGEHEDLYMSICFDEINLYDDDFRNLAMKIYGPILESMTVER